MNLRKSKPVLTVYSPDRKKPLFVVMQPYNFSCNYNFAAASVLEFNVYKKIYDERNEKWINNPCYDILNEDMVLHSSDSDSVFQFKGSTLCSSFIPNSNHTRQVGQMSFTPTFDGANATIQKEVELYDISNTSGYKWNTGCYIDAGTGCYIDGSDNIKDHIQYMACQDFFPVSEGDIIALRSHYENEEYFRYRIFSYLDADASTFNDVVVGSANTHSSNINCSRIRVDKSWFDNESKGYIRIDGYCPKNSADGNAGWVSYILPMGYIKIYSGEKHCLSIKNMEPEMCKLPIQWWIISDTKEYNDGINSYKKVTAYSYEYILSKRTFSLTSETLPLYIPDNLYKLINGINDTRWRIDAIDNRIYYGSQKMEKGLINQILEYIPNWSIGYISSGLATKYRNFSDVDNANIYSFLMNDIQSKYNCFVIFDVESRKINFISKDDVCEIGGNSTITWNNALKSLEIVNTDSRFITAMRVHSADDTYGMGLVNPLGSNMIYNFQSYKDYIDDDIYEKADQNLCNLSKKIRGDYRDLSKEFINLNVSKIKLESQLATALANYKAKADVINAYLQNDYSDSSLPKNYYTNDIPRALIDMTNGIYKPDTNYKNYHSVSLYRDLYDLSKTYYSIKGSLSTVTYEYNETYNKMKEISSKLSINYNTVQKGSSTSIFSKEETLALSDFIVEGDWTNQNVVFSETYSEDDIYNTLIDIYKDAKSDLDNIYSKRNYEFTAHTTNILSDEEMRNNVSNMYLGNTLFLQGNANEWIKPVLLSVHINYDDLSDYTMSFSTDYKRKPLELRFSDMFGTITQTSVQTPSYDFSD